MEHINWLLIICILIVMVHRIFSLYYGCSCWVPLSKEWVGCRFRGSRSPCCPELPWPLSVLCLWAPFCRQPLDLPPVGPITSQEKVNPVSVLSGDPPGLFVPLRMKPMLHPVGQEALEFWASSHSTASHPAPTSQPPAQAFLSCSNYPTSGPLHMLLSGALSPAACITPGTYNE